LTPVLEIRASSTHLRDIVDVGLTILIRVDIDAFVELKDKYLALGLNRAIRNSDDPFWNSTGVILWEELQTLVNDQLADGVWFGQHHESPAIVGVFREDCE
jgi:hypothetical protein